VPEPSLNVLSTTLLGWVRLHAPPALAARLDGCEECEVEYVPYDWGLNDRPPR